MLMLFSLADREVVPGLYEGLLLLRVLEGALVITVVAFATHRCCGLTSRSSWLRRSLSHVSVLIVSYLAAEGKVSSLPDRSFLSVMFLGTVMRLQLCLHGAGRGGDGCVRCSRSLA